MGITNSTKVLSAAEIPCGGTFRVTLGLTAEPNIVANPTDIVLILDRSGSMTRSLPALKNAAELFIDIIDEATDGGPPGPVAALAKSQGVIIYVIGLAGNGGIDEQALRDWASDPDSAYVAIAPSDDELEDLFADLAKNITKPGATDIVIDEKVTGCFRILSLTAPTKGTAMLKDERTLQWKIDELGVNRSEGAEQPSAYASCVVPRERSESKDLSRPDRRIRVDSSAPPPLAATLRMTENLHSPLPTPHTAPHRRLFRIFRDILT